MLSLRIHVQIVLKILDFGHAEKKQQGELIALKTNSVQLLIEKITSYSQGFLASASSII